MCCVAANSLWGPNSQVQFLIADFALKTSCTKIFWTRPITDCMHRGPAQLSAAQRSSGRVATLHSACSIIAAASATAGLHACSAATV